MNRNVEAHFSELPHASIGRSIFDRSASHKTTFNVGELIPFYIDEVLPGDTFKVTTSKVCRLQTLLTPVMDNLYLDTYYFFVPNRLVWSHWKEFNGENTQSAWYPSTSHTIPKISAPSGGFAVGTIADYFGLPVGVNWVATALHAPSALPFRAYAMICDQFFRDENLTDPLNIPTGDSNQTGTNGTSYINDVANGGVPFKVAKYHDYFTSCLPAPQKGPAVNVNLSNPTNVYFPVRSLNAKVHEPGDLLKDDETYTMWYNTSGIGGTAAPSSTLRNVVVNGGYFQNEPGSSPSTGGYSMFANNLWADIQLSNLGSISINELRLAFQLQKYYERNARGGTRYTEILRSHFGVTSPDSRLQRPEYLGGNRMPVNIREITNTAQTATDFLGDVGGKSVTSNIHQDFVHSFTEHGYVIGVCCLRYDHSYAQGLERFWSRSECTDFYLPVFANIGEQPVNKCEIYADNTTISNNSVFGYQEAWADYRYKPDRVSGEMRPQVTGSLALWHFADNYAAAPTLSDAWIREDKANVDRALAVTSAVSMQCFADFYVKNICTRPMPMYSIPGLIDHH